jgi:hypothetical protein
MSPEPPHWRPPWVAASAAALSLPLFDLLLGSVSPLFSVSTLCATDALRFLQVNLWLALGTALVTVFLAFLGATLWLRRRGWITVIPMYLAAVLLCTLLVPAILGVLASMTMHWGLFNPLGLAPWAIMGAIEGLAVGVVFCKSAGASWQLDQR